MKNSLYESESFTISDLASVLKKIDISEKASIHVETNGDTLKPKKNI